MQRIQTKRITRDTIIIITNGKETEKNYFKNITSVFSSMYKISIKFCNKQCDKMVEYAISLKQPLINQIWCVFDIDDTFTEGHLIKAIELAKSNDINLAYSNESFEVWLLNHLIEHVKPSLSRKNYSDEINKLLSKAGLNIQYNKNDEVLLKQHFIPNATIAAQRAKKTYQKIEAEYLSANYGKNNYPIWNWKSTTTVYKLIDTLKLNPKQNDSKDK